MDDEDKRGALAKISLQDTIRADRQPTESEDINQDIYNSRNGDTSDNIPRCFTGAYSIIRRIKCEHDPTEPKREHNTCSQQRHDVNDYMSTCVQCMVCDEGQQKAIEPYTNTDYDQTSTRNGNGFIEVKPVVKSDTDGHDGNMDKTRHWVVGPGGELKEIKAENTPSYLTKH